MITLYAYLILPAALTVIALVAAMIWLRNRRSGPTDSYAKCPKHRRNYAALCVWCRGLPGVTAWVGGVVAVIMWIIPLGVTVARITGELTCTERAERTGMPYEWLDVHFFSYECVLRTPAGNVTISPVLPIEDITERGDR